MEPIQLIFKDDGKIPNSKLPLLIYKNVFSEEKADPQHMIEHFSRYNWRNAWTDGVYDFHHYHSNTHEAMGIHQGYATLQFGGESGEQVSVEEGDVVVVPAGVGHRKISASDDFGVVGAYPDGRDYDLLKGEKGERPKADENIAAVPLPDNDPVHGKMEGLLALWKEKGFK
jgi:uncharacterized protein YjlB